MLFIAAFHQNRGTGIRTMENFFMISYWTEHQWFNKHKTTTALEAGKGRVLGMPRPVGT